MSDLIERSGAIDALKDMYQAAEKWGQEANTDVIKARAESCMASLVEMKLRIEKMPSAQPERKTGHWILVSGPDENGNATYRCSECHCAETHTPVVDVKFCWNCGSSMTEETVEDREPTMEEFMYGQDMGNPEDGSL